LLFTSFDNVGLLKVLNFLESHESEYLSGQDLSDVLKISRVAVWKHIEKIRSLGYKIDSKQKRGYKFVNRTERLLPWEITKKNKAKFIGRRIYYFDEIDSTQDFALQLSTNNKENGTIIIAEKQKHGKGRLDRKWYSPDGGIWLSIIIHPKFEISDTTIIPLLVSLALCESIKKKYGIKTNVKWPNDITINGKKVAGMLIDTTIQGNKIENLVLGVGINFAINTTQIQKRLQNTPNFYGVTSLFPVKNRASKMELLLQFLVQLEKGINDLTEGKKLQIIKKWSDNTDIFGKSISINTGNGKISGIVKKIDSEGALVIKTRNKTEKIFVGDVVLR
tara:strand:- start:6018 stop:7019 length:1002 start_codon:yes stop_codon:yes gene_type:complete